ncbi:type I-B CRISPR-associated protein Cas7/Cst2/DevR [Paraclostridium sordellii]|uniref:CRISPR-associated regulatory protein Cst2 n=1 Tax=Paraclostridium sordellii TaxID=1505 RepID=A0A0C7HZ18_PARSO|nr:type I-B CRISPR-associated protein Cas7/Cst2/DevR [Paeniclostridium sordellii]QYE99030.1 type I-B CRISPR-associated protein Cas7/Cst2/DevR [Paeniclostridium sordellii]CEN77817.1 CRISPR-associated regulatory protein Cst2 [[Clostridium] sordellii] [Paeniclostridium sordellii]CEO06664.1 CRISPR-associated regulatory protein Cst2 [[Clostridium] sordellii] [Paeniclostridium sordellii]CEP86629.1 CRISPR-associated regulatory protein Cst2 [[Clostridium] sordellii] [Paeniclostridium sordellii]CEP9751
MKREVITITAAFEGASLNYGEGFSNTSELKKMTRESGLYTYLSRQAIAFNLKEAMNAADSNLSLDGKVIQYDPNMTIEESIEQDLFGYMITSVKPALKRPAVVRINSAVSCEPFKYDTDFLSNLSMLDRFNKSNPDKVLTGGQLASSEIHKSYYVYSITVDLFNVGIDRDRETEISKSKKIERVHLLLDAINDLNRDIKGRRENLKPVFIVGMRSNKLCAAFENRIKIKNNKLNLELLEDSIEEYGDAVKVGMLRNIFNNHDEIAEKIEFKNVFKVIEELKEEVTKYYESN